VARVLDLSTEPDLRQGIGVNSPGAGIGYTIRARTWGPQVRGGALTAAVILGGRTDRPVLVTDWHWHASAAMECQWAR
jgi:hypothetical protein